MSNKLIPELRFPEFKDEGEWNYDKIDNLFHLQDGYVFSSNAFTDSKQGSKQVIRITDINNQNKNVDKVYVCEDTVKALGLEKYKVKKGDLLLSLTGAGGFNFFIWKSDDAYINQRTMKLYSKKKENDSLKVILEPLVHSKINEIGTGQNNNLSKDALKEIEFPFPNLKEQQKIASCLSSLDEVIAAHTQKLDLLKNHKKSLMQNLFPQEGEKVPKVRFKEFGKDGVWKEKKLGDKEVAFFVNEKISINKLTLGTYISTENMLPDFTGVSTISKLPSTGSFTKFRIGDILISNIRPYLKKVWKADKIGGASNDVLVFRSGSDVLSEFLEFILKNESFINYVMESAKGVKMPRGDKGSMLNYTVFIPSKEEQQKIASCLSSLDKIITAQAEKIEQLKLHKKGLMQGLFPKMN